MQMPVARRTYSSCLGHRLDRHPAGWLSLLAAVAWFVLAGGTYAAAPLVSVTGQSPGVKPFIELVTLHMRDPSLLDYIVFTIAPKTGSHTRPVSARYSSAYLLRRGFLNTRTGAITAPVFGLYAGCANDVTLDFGFIDGTSQTNKISIETAKYDKGGGIYNHPEIIQARSSATTLSYDFIMLKSATDGDSPKVIDTDGELRWVGTANTMSMEAILYDGGFYVCSGTTLLRMEFDGAVTTLADYTPLGVTSFHHNFDFGKSGIVVDVNTTDYTESVNLEVDALGNVLHSWNLADIISSAMLAGGDDPTLFVSPAGQLADWFHNNSTAYRPSDDSLVISSRENFVIALDYETGAIKWILGDPTKLWYQFASLRKYALKPAPGSHAPIGQHAVSFFRDNLLLFDDGFNSAYQYPYGKTRTYSAPRKYAINQNAGTATEIWNYLASPVIYSPVESSVYEDRPGNYLLDYATGGPYEFTEIMGLDASGAKAFDYRYPLVPQLSTAWNAVQIHLEALMFY